MACGDRKNTPGGPCCAPCDFGCDPCLGSVTIDAGVCGGATFMYPLTDPCEGIVTKAAPGCVWEDCMVDCCVRDEVELICEDECDDAPYCQDLGSGTGYCSTPQRREQWVRIKRFVKKWQITRKHQQYRYQLSFIGNKRLKIKVFWNDLYFFQHRNWFRSEEWRTAPVCKVNPCGVGSAPSGDFSFFSLISETGSPDYSGEACDNPLGGLANWTRTCPWDGDTNGYEWFITYPSVCGILLPGQTVGCRHNRAASATYEKIIDLEDCESFFGTFTLDRIFKNIPTPGQFYPINSPFDCDCDCAPLTTAYDDCFPETIDITLG